MNDSKQTPQHPDWGLLQIFLAISEAGSFGRAAQTLRQSQPTLSRRMAELETLLGQPLFERTPRGLRLTASGEKLRAPVERMRIQAQEVQLTADRHTRILMGTVRITASEVVSAHLLPPVLRKLREQRPEIQIELLPTDSVED